MHWGNPSGASPNGNSNRSLAAASLWGWSASWTFARDNVSDTLAIRVYQDAGAPDRKRSVVNTLWNLLARHLVSTVIVAQVAIVPMPTAAIVSAASGLALLALITYEIARSQGVNASWLMITEHLLVAAVVITAGNTLGQFISGRFH